MSITDDLTGTEAAVLLVLMAEARPVENPTLRTLGPELKKPSRDRLVKQGLIEVGRAGRSMTLELTDKGWKACADLMGGPPPPRATGPGKALFTVLAGMRRWFDRTDIRPAEFFAPADDPSGAADTGSETTAEEPSLASDGSDAATASDVIEARIREAYTRIAREPGTAVRLSRLRPELADIPRTALDAAFVRLRRAPDVSLIPEENQKTLTAEDRRAAVVVGNQHNHLMEIDQ